MSLSDDQLHASVRRLAARSNITLADLLAHLGEVEARGIHRDRACASLYSYCVHELRMSEDAAFRRAKAARIVREHPELRDVIARGELHLTGLLMIAPLLGGERRAEVLERARFRTKRELARLVAELDPKPAVPARIAPIGPEAARKPSWQDFVVGLAGPARELPDGDRPADWIGCGGREDEDAANDVTSARNGSAELARAEQALERAEEIRGATPTGRRPLAYDVRFTAGQEYVDLLEEAFDLLGGRGKKTTLPDVQLRALREFVERLRKRRTGGVAARGRATEFDGGQVATEGASHSEGRHTTERDGGRDAPARATTQGDATTRGTTDGDDGSAATDPPAAELDEPHGPPPDPRLATGRYVPAAVRRAVWNRDEGRCGFTDPRGQRCRETSGLEMHHRHAHPLGGPPNFDNLELRCQPHNSLAAE